MPSDAVPPDSPKSPAGGERAADDRDDTSAPLDGETALYEAPEPEDIPQPEGLTDSRP